MCAVAVIGGYTAINRSINYTPAKASVFVIERQCKFDREYADGKRETVTESCNSTDEFKSLAAQPADKRKKKVDGKAVVKVTYNSPKDGSYQTSSLHFDGRDEEFYQLKAGDEIDILVSNDDPALILKG